MKNPKLDMALLEKYKRTADVKCVFCNKKNCIFFLMRDSFYMAIKSHWDFIAIFDPKGNLEEIAQFKGDIFMGATYKELVKDEVDFDSSNSFKVEWRNKYYPTRLMDFYFLYFNEQIAHEAKVRHYIHQNKLTEVEVDGDVYKFDQNSFKVDFDFSVKARPCPVCDDKKCIDKYEAMQQNLRYFVHCRLLVGGLPQDYRDDDEMMKLENWTLIWREKGWQYWLFETSGLKVQASFLKAQAFEQRAKHDKVNRPDLREKPDRACEVCYKIANDFCSRCRLVRYCSVEHQRLDWPKHKKTCVPRPIDDGQREPQEI